MNIRRFNFHSNHSDDVDEVKNGEFVLYSDHAAEVERLEAKAYEAKCYCDGYMAALEKMDAEIERLTTGRDAAVARAERAEEALRLVRTKAIPAGGALVLQHSDWESRVKEVLDIIDAALATEPDKPQYTALAPEPWGGPEGEEEE